MRDERSTKDHILEWAKKEFLFRKYRSVSMREIAQSSGIVLSNIYYYFNSKDALYKAVLEPAIKAVYDYCEQHNSITKIKEDIECCKNDDFSHVMQEEAMLVFYDLICRYQRELYALMFLSEGSSVEHFADELSDRLTAMGTEYMERYKELYHKEDFHIEPMFMRTYSTMKVAALKELIRHEKLPKKKMDDFCRQLAIFSSYGWKKLMGI